jgi:hypothetical protein
MTATPLSESRAADRQKMAAALEQLVAECGASYQRSAGGTYPGPKAIKLAIEGAEGLAVTVTLDGASCQPNVYVLSWHMALGAVRKLNEATFGGSVNPHHKQKATYVAYGFDELLRQLQRGLMLAKDGSAFLPELELV